MLAMRYTHSTIPPMPYDIEFQQLEQFVTVARTKSITNAAKELNISQSALSRAIQKLEDQTGQPLFERKPREVVLTDLGELFLDGAKKIMKVTDDTFSELSEAGKHGRIRLGAIPTIAPYFLPTFLTQFAKEHPDVSVVVQEDTTENLIRRCNDGELDLAIMVFPIITKYLESEALFDEELLLVVPDKHPLSKKKEITAESVVEYPFVMLDEAHCLSDNIETYCRQQFLRPVSVERLSQLTTVQELVALGHGVSIVPEMAHRLDESERRVYRSFDQEKPTRTVAMLWNPYRYQSKWVQSMREHLRQHYAK